MEDKCKNCKHYIDQEWEGTEWKQCELQDLAWKYEECPLNKNNIKEQLESKMEDSRFKFRVWDKDNKNYTTCIDPDFFVRSIDEYDEKIIEYQVSVLDCQVIERYIGIKDKNGKPIYEGDILKYKNRAGEYCIAKLRRSIYRGYFLDDFNLDVISKLEVIGNIHKNPELIKE